MDSSRQALQTKGKFFFSNFELVFEIFAEIYSKDYQGVNIDQIAMCCISMD